MPAGLEYWKDILQSIGVDAQAYFAILQLESFSKYRGTLRAEAAQSSDSQGAFASINGRW